LDACCGGRAFWFDKADGRALFVDKRCESFQVDRRRGDLFHVAPDMLCDFSELPFPSDTFALVVFDPPHVSFGKTSFMAAMYGRLEGDWREMLRLGFAECFRVLRPEGVLVFKWCDSDVPLREILALTPEVPLIGNRKPATAKTHWVLFMKPNNAVRGAAEPRTLDGLVGQEVKP
jgi:SAM-dependent methyltransferase